MHLDLVLTEHEVLQFLEGPELSRKRANFILVQIEELKPLEGGNLGRDGPDLVLI